MVFNSVEFGIFLVSLLYLYFSVFRGDKQRDVLLLVASYIFYMAWYWTYAGLIFLSSIVDFFIGKKLYKEQDQKRKKLFLFASLATNLSLLGIFKYFNFFSDTTATIFSGLGFQVDVWHHELLLPVGISFYTFQTLSYTLDIYRGKIKPEPKFIKFATYVAFFPQLVAGPIVRAADFLPQLNRKLAVTDKQIQLGLSLICLGLIKKVCIADTLALLAVDAAFENPQQFSSLDLLFSLYAYAFQIYCDFSGYSDIAIGVAMLFGFKFPVNFNKPYLSASPSEFWTRWHISLSSWLRDYLYISLGGNRGTSLMTYRNLFLTMLLGGLWHGAAMNFILWGIFHGSILILYRLLKVSNATTTSGLFLQRFIFFHLVVFGWLLFRVTSMDNFLEYSATLLSFSTGISLSPLFFFILLVASVSHFIDFNRIQECVGRFPILLRSIAYTSVLLLVLSFSVEDAAFIYFQF
ncbi:MAG: MBOAT family O-acyltransferase [Pseudomonadales bacterium]